MKLLGLTGGIGMGKSTSASLLARAGVPVIDTDDIAREVVQPGQPALAEIASRFGREFLDERGVLRRAALAQLVFASADKRRELESILHPRIRERWLRQREVWEREGKSLGVVVIPLLFETGAEMQFNAIICTACSRETQLDRLSARGWPVEQIEQRLAAQWSVEKKIVASNFVVWTEGELDVHRAQIERILRPW